MSEIITFPMPDGADYVIPDIGDENWGQNVTDFLVAIPNGVVPRSGTFTLTGDVSFGASFGLVSAYFKSGVVNPSTAGLLRLAKTDSIGWRNNANGGNNILAVNSSDELTYNGSTVLVGGVTSITGTANQVIASAATGAVTLSTPQNIGTSSSPTFSGLTLSSLSTAGIVHNAVTTGILSSSLLVNADVSASAAIAVSKLAALTVSSPVKTDGSGFLTTGAINLANSDVTGNLSTSHLNSGTSASSSTFWRGDGTWAAPAGSGTVNSGTAGDIAYYASSTNAVTTAGSSAVSAGSLNLVAVSNQLVLGTTRTATLTAPTPGTSSRTYTFPDLTGDYSVVATIGAQTIAGVKTFSAQDVHSSGISITGNTTSNYILASSSNATALSSALINTENSTASSDMSFLLRTGGASGGDPYMTFNVSGVTNWSIGVDNSVSDSFAIRPAATPNAASSALVIDTASVVTLSTQGIIHGTSTNDAATAGFVGEYITSSISTFTSTGTSSQWADLTSISLTAGDWDVSAQLIVRLVGTVTQCIVGTSSTSGNSATGLVIGDNYMAFANPTATNDSGGTISSYRVSLSSTTTYYLKMNVTWAGSQATAAGCIRARRMR